MADPQQPANGTGTQPRCEASPHPSADAGGRRLSIPSAADIRRGDRARDLAADDVLWRAVASEAHERPADEDIDEERLIEALEHKGLGWAWLSERIAAVRAARRELHPIDRPALERRLEKAQRDAGKATEKAARLREQAEQVERDAATELGLAHAALDDARRITHDAAQLAQTCALEGCPGGVDLGLRVERRIVRVTRPTIEMGQNVDPGAILDYVGPWPRPWLQDYDGPVKPGGVDPIVLLDVNEANQRSADAVEGSVAQFHEGGLPGQTLMRTDRLRITARPTRETDFPDASPLPTHAVVKEGPADPSAIPEDPDASQPEPWDPWELRDE